MKRELFFHLYFLAILLALGAIRLWYYRGQRRSMGAMAIKKQETLNDLRQTGAMVASGVIVMHIINPDLLSWTEVATHVWIRWAGLILSTLAVGACLLAARDELAVARTRHETTFDPPGLFRCVRHPIELGWSQSLGA